MRLTFDNLGEAADLERGTWPADRPLGCHPSVTEVLPALLDELDRDGLRATFFVEGLNCALYPDALREIAARGHELGVHGWRHEAWSTLPVDRERELLERAGEAFAGLGIKPRAFRPPGGTGTARTRGLLLELGYAWCSSAVDDPAPVVAGVREVPFAWDLVDAYHLMESFAGLRARRGDPRSPLDARLLGERLVSAVGEDGGVLVLHPFLMLDDAWFTQVRRLLAALGAQRDGAGR